MTRLPNRADYQAGLLIFLAFAFFSQI